MSGFDRAAAEAVIGKLAPWVRDLDLRIEHLGPDAVTLRMPYDDRLARVGGLVCGQALMALADTAMIFVVSAATGGFREMATTNCSVSFLRPVAGRDVLARGRALKTGRLLVFGEVLLYADGEAEPAAQATCTYALPPPR